jgi:heme-degrading monooxygenase HmoA
MRYLTIGIHFPKPEHLKDIIAVAKKVADEAKKCEGLVDAGSWYDKENDRLVMMSLWESQEHAVNAGSALRPLIMSAPWSDWERQPSDNFLGLSRIA